MDKKTTTKPNNTNNKKIISITSDITNNNADYSSTKQNNSSMLSSDNLLNFDGKNFDSKRKDSAIPKGLISKSIGTRLKIIRLMTGLNLKEFGSMCKIESGMFGRYERGETPLSVASAIRVAITVRDLYHIYTDPNWILNGEGTRPCRITSEEKDHVSKSKNILETLQAYIYTYHGQNDILNLLNSNTEDEFLKPESIIAGNLIDLTNLENLKNLDYQYCFLRLKDNKEMLAHVTYDETEHMFTVQIAKPRKLFCLKVEEVSSISTIFFNLKTSDAAEAFRQLSQNKSEIMIK